MRPETWNLKQVLVISVVCAVVASLIACLPATSTPPALTPTLRAEPQGEVLTAAPSPTATPSPFPTLTSTATPTPSPTCAPMPTATSLPTATFAPLPTVTLPPTLTPTPTPATDTALVRGPYLQSVTTDSVIVVWETNRPSHGEVAYDATIEYGSVVADAAVGTRHAVALTGLAPYAVYHYSIESSGVPLSADATFRTAAGPGQAFTFVVFGDTRTQHQIHRAVVDRIVAQQPDFAINTGDLVANGESLPEWETFFEIEQELMARVPLFPTLGNHERNAPHYFDLFYLPGNEHWYAFDYGDARFVCLQVDGIADFGPGSEQYAWLEATLAANTQPWLFVAFHIPPYSSVQEAFENEVRQPLRPLFERYGVDIVFNGHKHNYERNEVNGVTYIVTGGGGAPLYEMREQEPTQAAFALAHHFVLLEVDGHQLKATAISVDGTVLDAFERGLD
ncbi:MAG: metallophosphoesterase [Anaerolineae bacterium]